MNAPARLSAKGQFTVTLETWRVPTSRVRRPVEAAAEMLRRLMSLPTLTFADFPDMLHLASSGAADAPVRVETLA